MLQALSAFLDHPRVRWFCLVYLVALVLMALGGCGGGDPEPLADERVSLPSQPASGARQ